MSRGDVRVTDPPHGSHLDRIGEAVYGVRRGEEETSADFRARCREALFGPVPAPYAWLSDSSPREQAKRRADRFETQLPGLLDAAPRGARDGFGRRQGAGWEAWLRALADVQERVVTGGALGLHRATVLAMANGRWSEITGIRAEAYRGTPGAGGEP